MEFSERTGSRDVVLMFTIPSEHVQPAGGGITNVFPVGGDPAAAGFVDSLARPGGNATV